MKVTFEGIPKSFEEFEAAASAMVLDAEQTAALFILALTMYVKDNGEGLKAIAYLKEPGTLSNRDIAFLRDRLSDKQYLPFSYYVGASPENKYTVSAPFVLDITGDKPDAAGGYKKVFVTCGGADSSRPVTLLQKGNRYYLWEYSSILSGIRKPL